MPTRPNVPEHIRRHVLAEAGYRCAVPTCRTILAIDLHHIEPVSDGGSGLAENLVALCPTCHALHHRGTIPIEAIRAYKRALAELLQRPDLEAPSADTPTRSALRVLYFHDQPRSEGLDFLRSPRLAEQLQKRGHSVRFCWAVYQPLTNDADKLSEDLLSPEFVRNWQPQALIFERGLFVGDPRLPHALLDDLQDCGAVVLLAIPASEYEKRKPEYDTFFLERGITVPAAEHEEPRCHANSRFGGPITFSVDELRYCSCAPESVLEGVSSVIFDNARPIAGLYRILLIGQKNVFVKAYHNSEIHGVTYPFLGLLNDNNGRSEAIFLADIACDAHGAADNAVYLSNLMEWLHEVRRRSMLWSALQARADEQ